MLMETVFNIFEWPRKADDIIIINATNMIVMSADNLSIFMSLPYQVNNLKIGI